MVLGRGFVYWGKGLVWGKGPRIMVAPTAFAVKESAVTKRGLEFAKAMRGLEFAGDRGWRALRYRSKIWRVSNFRFKKLTPPNGWLNGQAAPSFALVAHPVFSQVLLMFLPKFKWR